MKPTGFSELTPLVPANMNPAKKPTKSSIYPIMNIIIPTIKPPVVPLNILTITIEIPIPITIELSIEYTATTSKNNNACLYELVNLSITLFSEIFFHFH